MPYTLNSQNKADAPSFRQLYLPVYRIPIRTFGDPVLRTVAAPIDGFTSELERLVDDARPEALQVDGDVRKLRHGPHYSRPRGFWPPRQCGPPWW